MLPCGSCEVQLAIRVAKFTESCGGLEEEPVNIQIIMPSEVPHNVDGKRGLGAKDGSRPVDGCDIAEDSWPEPNSAT